MGLSVRGLKKSFGAKSVLNSVDLDVGGGEIHALLGPNGSGKSTLIGCLSGSLRPDGGTIELNGSSHASLTPRAAFRSGTATIYQHLSLIPTLTVTDNLFMGDEIRRQGRIDRKAEDAITAQVLRPFERPITPRTLVGALSTGDRQIVEIAKALRHHPSLLILDEPTAALSESEVQLLLPILRRLRAEGMAILYVTHLLPEVFAIADRVTVLRDGDVVLTRRVEEVDHTQVVAALAPRMSREVTSRPIARMAEAEPILELAGFEVDWVGPIDLRVGVGETVGIFGLLGAGRTEILEALYGIRRRTAGTMRVHRGLEEPRSPREAVRAGIALVPTDRLRQGILDRLSSLDNVTLPHVSRLSRWGMRRGSLELDEFRRIADRLSLTPSDPGTLAWKYSGGNQQKLVVGRWLSPSIRLDLMLLDEPTQGIDVGARADLYGLLHQLASDEGRAILFTSSDPEETLALADRIYVLRRGRIITELSRSDADEHTLLSIAHGAMAGGDQEAPPAREHPSVVAP